MATTSRSEWIQWILYQKLMRAEVPVPSLPGFLAPGKPIATLTIKKYCTFNLSYGKYNSPIEPEKDGFSY